MSEMMTDDGLPVDDTSAPEPVAADPVEASTPETTAETPWTPPREEWDQIRSTLDRIANPPQPEQQAPGFEQYFPQDPITGETSLTIEGLQRFVEDQVQARLSTVEPVLNQTVIEQGERIIEQKFTELKGTVGDFDTALARELAEGYASTGTNPDEALARAARRAHEFAEAQRQAGVETYKTTLQNIGNAPREPGAAGAAVADEARLPVGHPDRYKALANAWAERQKLAS